VVCGNTAHYEVVGVKRNGLIQTVFGADDPFLVEMRKLFEGGREENYIPDVAFVRNASEIFTIATGQLVLPDAARILGADDPFTVTLNRVRDQIKPWSVS